MADLGKTEVDVTIEEVVSSIVQEELKANAVLAPSILDMSSLARPGMDKINFPRAGGFTAEAKAENTALTAQTITYVNDGLDLDQHKAILARVEDIAGLQAKPDVIADIVRRMGKELAIDFDSYIYTQLQAASASAPDHRILYDNNATDNTLGKVDILEARRLLNVQHAPMDDRFLLISPGSEKSLLAIDDFVHVDKYGASAQGLSNGELGRIYGFKVLMSPIVDDVKTIAYYKGCCAFAYQQQVRFEQARDLPNVASEYLMHTLYGSTTMQGGKWQVMLGTAS